MVFVSFFTCKNQQNQEVEEQNIEDVTVLTFKIHASVTNSEDDDAKEVIALWKSFLLSKYFVQANNAMWSYTHSPIPDYYLMKLYLLLQRNEANLVNTICTIIGVFPVENDHMALKCMFESEDQEDDTLELLVSVYAKKENGLYMLVGSPDYYRQQRATRTIGQITYYIHPEHKFDEALATKMHQYNQYLASEFRTDPISFDYFVANYVRDATKIMGYDFTPKKYQAIQYGGLADKANSTIYAGNNSEYYPHELVHLYTFQHAANQYHPWVDEGIATFYGGSGGESLDWHLNKLKLFLEQHPDYPLNDLSKLNIDIPNGEHKTDFRYAIGGLIMKNIYELEGMRGFFESLTAGRQEADFFKLLESKLGVQKTDFEQYIRGELVEL